MELKESTTEYLETGSREMRGDVLVHTMYMLHFVIFGIVDVHLSGSTLFVGVYPCMKWDDSEGVLEENKRQG